MNRFRGLACCALALMVVTVGACSDGDDDDASGGGGSSDGADSPERDSYVEALAGSLEGGLLADDERECFAVALVDTVGVDALADKVEPDDIDADFNPADVGIAIDEEQGSEFYDRLSDCADVRALVLESLNAGQELPAETVQCLEEGLDDDLIEQLVVTSFTQGDAATQDAELTQAINEAVGGCTSPGGG